MLYIFECKKRLEVRENAVSQGMVHAAARPRFQDLPGLPEIIVEEIVYRLLRLHYRRVQIHGGEPAREREVYSTSRAGKRQQRDMRVM